MPAYTKTRRPYTFYCHACAQLSLQHSATKDQPFNDFDVTQTNVYTRRMTLMADNAFKQVDEQLIEKNSQTTPARPRHGLSLWKSHWTRGNITYNKDLLKRQFYSNDDHASGKFSSTVRCTWRANGPFCTGWSGIEVCNNFSAIVLGLVEVFNWKAD